jgi:hypothetical protein
VQPRLSLTLSSTAPIDIAKFRPYSVLQKECLVLTKRGKHADGGKLINFRTVVSQLYREELTRRSNTIAKERGESVIAHCQIVLSKFIEEMTSDQERDAKDYQEQRNTSGLHEGLSWYVIMKHFFHILTSAIWRSGWLGTREAQRGHSGSKAYSRRSCSGNGCMAGR